MGSSDDLQLSACSDVAYGRMNDSAEWRNERNQPCDLDLGTLRGGELGLTDLTSALSNPITGSHSNSRGGEARLIIPGVDHMLRQNTVTFRLIRDLHRAVHGTCEAGHCQLIKPIASHRSRVTTSSSICTDPEVSDLAPLSFSRTSPESHVDHICVSPQARSARPRGFLPLNFSGLHPAFRSKRVSCLGD